MNPAQEEKVDVRKAEQGDISAMLNILESVGGKENKISREDLLNSDLGGELDLSFVAEIGGRIVGLLIGRFAVLGVPAVEVGFIQVIAVDPNYMRRHIGDRR